MPKVNIYDPTPRGVNIETGEPGPEQLRRVMVGWSRGLNVQVGIGWVDQFNIATAPAGWTSSAASASIDETDEKGRAWLGQWCSMDRHTINQLIRELRAARDQAFGRDE